MRPVLLFSVLCLVACEGRVETDLMDTGPAASHPDSTIPGADGALAGPDAAVAIDGSVAARDAMVSGSDAALTGADAAPPGADASSNPCLGKSCATGEVCNAATGACECSASSCPAQYHCDASSKHCLPDVDLCPGVTCDPGEDCDPLTGNCSCTATSCLPGNLCNAAKHCEVDCSVSVSHPFSIAITGGDGMYAVENWPAGKPMEVQVEDVSGKPAPCVQVSWTASQGSPGINPPTSKTDAQGKAQSNFRGTSVSASYSYETDKIVASMVDGQVVFTETMTDSGPQGQLFTPEVDLQEPQTRDLGTVKAGSVLSGAIQVLVASSTGPQQGKGIPFIAVRVANDESQPAGPDLAWCVGAVVTDDTGSAICDLKIGSTLGTGSLRVIVGEAVEFNWIRLDVTQ
jgi:hypothetical protein